MTRPPLSTLPAAVLAIPALVAPAQSPADEVDYAREVLPVLADHCFACHGPDAPARRPKSNPLRLDEAASAHAPRRGAPAIVPGEPDASEMILLLREGEMPPAELEDPLADDEIALLERWVEQGGEYELHWAYSVPRRPGMPTTPTGAWGKNALDAFVLADLESRGRRPSPPADARGRVRRLSFDLLGLPPTRAQVDAVAEDPDGAAWDELVEELLGSPHHAERLTTFWFDLVRFADTTGIHADNRWNIAPYRDWVIDAFRSNMPFDEFTRAQLAGDLLPNATLDQRVAAAYNRLNLITREGGSQPKEFLVRYTADRVRNVSEVWLATTVGCAECHDHKFDPVTTREFYELGAFFADIEQVGVYTQSGRNTFLPELGVPSAEQAAELVELEAGIVTVEERLAATTPELERDRLEWEASALRAAECWTVLAPLEVEAQGTVLSVQEDGSVLATGGDAATDTYRVVFELPEDAVSAIRLELLADPSLPREGPGRAGNGNLVVSELELRADGERVAITGSVASFSQAGYSVEGAHDGQRGREGWAVMQASGSARPATAAFVLGSPLSARRLELVLHQDHGDLHTIGHWRVAVTGTEPIHFSAALDEELRALVLVDPATRTPEQTARLDALHRERTRLLSTAREELAELERERSELQSSIPLVLETRAVAPQVTRVLPRGNWMDESGPEVQPGVPAALGELPKPSGRPTRLDLADWLVDGDNPLVARVMVNRLWRIFFGRGIVESLDDFGVQGASPAQPELLDYLAVELVESGWDVRHVVRMIVRSAAYSQASPAGDDGDPGFSRQTRFRLDAEFVRDNALAVSGLLVRDVGGPSVRPYQPAGHWAHLNFPRRTYEPSTGDDLYRRALYGHWQRQFLHPSMLAFDAPTRERCTAERARSNTPQAALALLNDPIFVEAARALATRLLREAPDEDPARVSWLFDRVLQRAPDAAERSLLLDLLARHRSHYAARPDEAARLLAVGDSAWDTTRPADELAAWTSVARVLLNLHETITRS